MNRKITAAVLAGLGALGTAAAARLLATFTGEVIPAFEDVLDDDWGAPADTSLDDELRRITAADVVHLHSTLAA